MMHSSSAVETPPSVSAFPALVHGRMFPSPREVLIRPSPSRSTHVLYTNGGLRYWPAGLGLPSAFTRVPPRTIPMRTTEPLPWPPEVPVSARFATHTFPNWSTVVRDGS